MKITYLGKAAAEGLPVLRVYCEKGGYNKFSEKITQGIDCKII